VTFYFALLHTVS